MISASLSGAWLLAPSALEGLARTVDHMQRMAFEPNGDSAALPDFADPLPQLAPGLVHIRAMGVLMTRSLWRGREMLATGYDLLSTQFAQAFADPGVKAILFEIDSPGGMVGGCPELAEQIYAGRMATGKAVAAVLSPQAYSAAYWLAAACLLIAVPESGGCGNIGCISIRTTESRRLQASGIDVAVIRSGPRKGLGNMVEPFAPAFLEEEQAAVNAVGRKFAIDVARYRDLPVQRVIETGGAAYTGPDAVRQALALGLVDAVASPTVACCDFWDIIQSI